MSFRTDQRTIRNYIVNAPVLKKKVEEGIAYTCSDIKKSLASGSSVGFLLQNPSGSGKEVHVVVVEVVGKAEGDIEVYLGVTVTASGTSIPITNMNRNYPDNSVCSAEFDGTYDTSGATRLHRKALPGGSGIRAIGSATELGEEVVLPEGDNILILIYNTSDKSSDYSCEFTWYEE